jgi:hypothetical protein
VGYEVLSAVSLKMSVLCFALPASLEAVRTSETLKNFYQTIGRFNPEDKDIFK